MGHCESRKSIICFADHEEFAWQIDPWFWRCVTAGDRAHDLGSSSLFSRSIRSRFMKRGPTQLHNFRTELTWFDCASFPCPAACEYRLRTVHR